MTPEVQNQIIDQFWGIVPTIAVFLVIAALLGIGYKILTKKLSQKINNKRNKIDNKKNNS